MIAYLRMLRGTVTYYFGFLIGRKDRMYIASACCSESQVVHAVLTDRYVCSL